MAITGKGEGLVVGLTQVRGGVGRASGIAKEGPTECGWRARRERLQQMAIGAESGLRPRGHRHGEAVVLWFLDKEATSRGREGAASLRHIEHGTKADSGNG
jgi:hypothetical protein